MARKIKPTRISRRDVSDVLVSSGVPMSPGQLMHRLGAEDEKSRLKIERHLLKLQQQGIIMRDRQGKVALLEAMNVFPGKVMAHRDGHGFLRPDNGLEDCYISPRQMFSVLHGDTVLARVVSRGRRAKTEVHIVDLLESEIRQIVGRFSKRRGVNLVLPEDRRILHDVVVSNEYRHSARPGEIVVCEIIQHPFGHRPLVGRITEVLGQHMTPGMETEIAIRRYGLPCVWSQDVDEEIACIDSATAVKDLDGRVDYRPLDFVTIDGEDARDFDDAVYCEGRRSGWRLWVAIADVGYYVKEKSALDKEAENRGTSVYFPGRVIPMLPPRLSDDLCSLRPDKDRLCMVCRIDISAEGKLLKWLFQEAVIRSRARLTYTVVADYFSGSSQPAMERPGIRRNLDNLQQLYIQLKNQRTQAGSIDLDLPAPFIELDEDRKVTAITALVRNDAHRLVEECMLVANICAARELDSKRVNGPFRIHEAPSAEKIMELREVLASFGLNLRGGDKPGARDISRLVSQLPDDRSRAYMIQMMILRSMSQARYNSENRGHFALGFSHYTHFTSPIRRYPDLLVHRRLRALLHKQKISTSNRFQELMQQCSDTERRAEKASRSVIGWLKAEYMSDRVGDVFSGSISSVTHFGIFVMLDDCYVDGLVHVTALGNDYYDFDPVHMRLVGRRHRRRFQLADRLAVQVVRVDREEGKIDFELAD